MKRFASILTAALAAAAFGCHSHPHDEHHEHGHHHHDETKTVDIVWNDVPANVRSAFEKEFPGAKVIECEKETYANGTIHYEFEYKDAAGQEHDVEFSASGEKLEPH